ncbi:dynein regulatory complex subunit 2 [Schistocerca cancellata]|uniref:dynein regulatory complex subunit 2 n=1 Tax=Schistocerca cancellata TaxID=274614 RepID=UPI0021174049|nr:dynein regulatory complex subunit 2 [Schistocerca cancellata]
MGPKKKGKGNKLSRMSEEERARYLQHRAAIEEEARRRKQQLIATFMKNKLKHEEAFTRLNMAKINQEWRQILRNIKTKELKQNLTALWESFQHVTSYKTQVMENLLKDMEDAADQYNRILQCHTEATDRLLQIHEARLSHLHNIYLEERKSLLHAAEKERCKIQETANAEEEYLRVLLYGLQASMDKFSKEGIANQMAKVDERRNNLLSDFEQMQDEKRSVIENIWRDFQQVLRNYFSETENRRSHYHMLKSQDSESTKTINDCNMKINLLTEQVAALKLQLTTLKSEQNKKKADLIEEQEHWQKSFWDMRVKLSNEKKLDEKQMLLMVTCSNNTINELNVIIKKAEQIFHLFGICSKYETEREKVIPFGFDLLPPSEGDDLKTLEKQDISDPLLEEILTYQKLENFWRKYNNVFLESAALKLHHEALTIENQQLKTTLRHYLSVMSRGNDPENVKIRLMGARPSTTRAIRKHITLMKGYDKISSKRRPVTCIEANGSIAVKHMLRSKFV